MILVFFQFRLLTILSEVCVIMILEIVYNVRLFVREGATNLSHNGSEVKKTEGLT